MTDYRKFFDKDFLGAWDIPDKDITLTIADAKGGELTGPGGRKSKKPILKFEKTEKAMALNATNGKIIAGMYGVHVEEWVGKRITLFKTQTQMGGDTVDCIRIRPQVPAPRKVEDAA